jgi:hypothetical protein
MGTRSWQALVAAAIAIAIDVLYVVIIWHEGEGELTSGRFLFVAGSFAVAAVALVAGTFVEPGRRALLFAAGAAILVVWTVLAALSIGFLIAPAAVLAVLATLEVLKGNRRAALVGALAAVAVAVAGLYLT